MTAGRPALSGRTIVMSGGRRGIGLAILVAAARHGANAVPLARTGQPHPKLPGTVHAAVTEMMGGAAAMAVARRPEIMADAAVEIFRPPPSARTGQTLIDAEVLTAAGVHDLSGYGGGENPALDLYIDPKEN